LDSEINSLGNRIRERDELRNGVFSKCCGFVEEVFNSLGDFPRYVS
jgi:hypothetical protein